MGTFEEFYSFAVDDSDSVFESDIVSKELCKCNAFWTSWRGSICFFFLRHCPGFLTSIPFKDSDDVKDLRPQNEWLFEQRVPKYLSKNKIIGCNEYPNLQSHRSERGASFSKQ